MVLGIAIKVIPSFLPLMLLHFMQKYLTILCLLLGCGFTYASTGTIEDSIADTASWIILLILPFAGIYLFWKVHIYPEKVAEKKNHPQLNAIKSMCLLSLVFGGLLWPVALIWANYDYSKDKKIISEPAEEEPLSEPTQNPQE